MSIAAQHDPSKVLGALRAQVERQNMIVLEVINLLERVVRSDAEEHVIRGLASKRHAELVSLALERARRALTVAEIAAVTGLPQSAVRVVLYQARGTKFEPEYTSPRKVRWSLKPSACGLQAIDTE